MIDEDRRRKLTERLKKCLALRSSPEPHEAAAALRQAQALMRELGITEDDLEGLETADATVKTREGFGACRTMQFLSSIISQAFAVSCVYERNPGSANRLNVRYFGPRSRVMLAEYAHRVVWRAMQQSWDDFLTRRPWLKGDGGKRQAFHIGWLCAVAEKVEAIAPTEAEERSAQRAIARAYGNKELEPAKAAKQKPLSAGAFAAGLDAAQDFTLHRPVESQQLSLEHKA